MREKERNGKRDIVRGSHQEGRTRKEARKVEKENTGERKEKGEEERKEE